jgi:hypothetical protein
MSEFVVRTKAKDRHTDEFVVELPHQCGAWVVAWEDSKESAAASLRTFIEEATAALAELENLQPCQHEWRFERDDVGNSGVRHLLYCTKCKDFVWDLVTPMSPEEAQEERRFRIHGVRRPIAQ